MKHYRYNVGTKDPKMQKHIHISNEHNNPDKINRRVSYNKPKYLTEQEILEDLKNTYKGETS